MSASDDVRVDAGLEAAIFYDPDEGDEEFEQIPPGALKRTIGRWLLRLFAWQRSWR